MKHIVSSVHHTKPASFATFVFAALVVGSTLCTSCTHENIETSAAAVPGAKPTATPAPTPTPTPSPARMPIASWARKHVIHRVKVKPGNKVFALTFDDGPWPRSTREILQILKENDVHATFFMVGQEVSRRPQIAREVRDAGHAIGNHSWDHPSRPRDPVAQITRTDAAIKKAIGYTPTTFRPPYGIVKNGMAHQAMKENDAVLIWSADCADWKRPGADHIARMIIGQASPGGIALMHDGGGDRSQTVAALPIIISTLRAKGYRFVTIPQLLAMRYDPPKTAKPSKTKASKAGLRKAPHSKGKSRKVKPPIVDPRAGVAGAGVPKPPAAKAASTD